MLSLHQCYEVLGVRPNAPAREVRQAYLEQVKRWHPDRHCHPNHVQAQDRFIQIQAAYDYIKQQQNVTPVRHPRGSHLSQTMPSTSKAESLYQNAIQLARQGLYHKAIIALSSAIEIDPKYALAYKYRGHLKAYLGLEHASKIDLKKAEVISRSNAAVQYQAPFDFNATRYSSHCSKPRSSFSYEASYGNDFFGLGKLLRESLWPKVIFWMVFLILMVGDHVVTQETPSPHYSQPSEHEPRWIQYSALEFSNR